MANAITSMNDRLYSILNTENGTLNTWSPTKDTSTKSSEESSKNSPIDDYVFNNTAKNIWNDYQQGALAQQQQNAFADSIISALTSAAPQQADSNATPATGSIFDTSNIQPVSLFGSLGQPTQNTADFSETAAVNPSTGTPTTTEITKKTEPTITRKDLVMQAPADNPWGFNTNWERHANDLKRQLDDQGIPEKMENREFMETHGISSDGIPYQITSSGKKMGFEPDSAQGKQILEQYNRIKSGGDSVLATDDEIALYKGTKSVNAQQYKEFLNKNKGILEHLAPETKAKAEETGELAKNDPYQSANPLLRNGQASAVFATQDELSKTVYGNNSPLSSAQLKKATDAVQLIKSSLIEDLDKSVAAFGSVEDATYALQHPENSADSVAKDILKEYGITDVRKKSLASLISKTKNAHPELTNAAIGMAVKKCMQHSSDNSWWTRETDLAGDLSIRDTEFNDTIKALTGNVDTNWKSITKKYARAQNFAQDIDSLTTNIQITQQAVDQQLKNAARWGGKITDKDRLYFMDQTNIDATNKSKALVQSLNTIVKRINDDYINVPSAKTTSESKE